MKKLCSTVLIILLLALTACTNEQDAISSQKQQTVKETTTATNHLQNRNSKPSKKAIKNRINYANVHRNFFLSIY